MLLLLLLLTDISLQSSHIREMNFLTMLLFTHTHVRNLEWRLIVIVTTREKGFRVIYSMNIGYLNVLSI